MFFLLSKMSMLNLQQRINISMFNYRLHCIICLYINRQTNLRNFIALLFYDITENVFFCVWDFNRFKFKYMSNAFITGTALS